MKSSTSAPSTNSLIIRATESDEVDRRTAPLDSSKVCNQADLSLISQKVLSTPIRITPPVGGDEESYTAWLLFTTAPSTMDR